MSKILQDVTKGSKSEIQLQCCVLGLQRGIDWGSHLVTVQWVDLKNKVYEMKMLLRSAINIMKSLSRGKLSVTFSQQT